MDLNEFQSGSPKDDYYRHGENTCQLFFAQILDSLPCWQILFHNGLYLNYQRLASHTFTNKNRPNLAKRRKKKIKKFFRAKFFLEQ